MTDRDVPQETRTIVESGINWAGVAVGGLLLALLVAVIEPIWLRVAAAIAALVVTIYIAHAQEEREIENPVLETARAGRPGLDRRKYGRLRAQTNRFLSHVREMNRVAVDARSGRVTQRHAHGELDRIASKMRDVVDEIRKSAGIPTPEDEARTARRPGAGGTSPGRPRPSENG